MAELYKWRDPAVAAAAKRMNERLRIAGVFREEHGQMRGTYQEADSEKPALVFQGMDVNGEGVRQWLDRAVDTALEMMDAMHLQGHAPTRDDVMSLLGGVAYQAFVMGWEMRCPPTS